ncbi:NADH dehydrogenase [ubiquinone] 1 alpha subcomplex subunit 6 [Blastocystis sp. ATCC 50177/Nand II]|uniref:NADH dehydrogenase [ubiquinone] 1 alpha subcomplex subunit 6 n=1 Tax=Blastocystis sp. subtype 1 (strain ATCC 50177 / NandII) TaxID=478820 RepID=A0A196SJ50_BLAHN|nr:NADH dehydrogenase [ubiquinone] 1 alpha subcomplex subunit 6 [Blastocystis sp. ATCC 50177/Nand II]
MSAYAYLMKMGPALSSKAASEKAVLLYKAIVQQLPKIISTYQMNMTMDEAKKIVKNKVAEILVYRGAMELDELVNQFPHEYQAAYYFESEPLRERDKFMAQKPDYLDQLLSDFEPNL